ncbi:MAG: nucleotidyltransferase family protein [Candidatus Omnitrophica bacterium]|nr:nucleotidyltransferase family protein [Candidatus Omnitrophota bacterium]
MKAIILAAGYGTRLYPLTKERAKPLLPIRGKPIIEFIVNKVQLIEEVEEIFIVSNNRFFKQFQQWLDNFNSETPIKLINDGSLNHKDKLGAVKDLAFVCEKENIDDDLLVLGGDNLFSFSLDEFVDFTKKLRPNNVIGVYNLNGKLKANKFGIVKMDNTSKVIEFFEKPNQLNGSQLISTCLYFFPKEKVSLIKEYFQADNDLDKIGSYLEWLSQRDSVYGYTFQGDWFDIGDLDSYTEAVFTF